MPARSHAQWWAARAPADYEECAEAAEKTATKEAKTTQIAECGVKFAARRKAGGGYSYFDFMQNRHFDIAGPNPTPEEQKHIDEQYAEYLSPRTAERHCRGIHPEEQLQRAAPESEKKAAVPLPASKPRTRGYSGQCDIPTQNRKLPQRCLFVQLAAACRGHQGLQENFRFFAGQGQTQPVVDRACDV